jgi:sirohydrochlorin ferrochelatase
MGIIIFAHGSRIESANDGVRRVAADVAKLGSFRHVQAAFLELGQPSLAGAAAKLAADGVDEIVVIPYFLTLGLHLERDLPQIVAEAAAAHANIKIKVSPPLEGHPALVQILLDRWKQAT